MVELLHQLLERSAQRDPDAVAVVDGARRLRYGELLDEAARLARLLIDNGVQRGDRVGIWVDKSHAAVSAIYAALMAGAAYVPLDPNAPAARLGYILGDCEVRLLVCGRRRLAGVGELVAAGAPVDTVVVVDADRHELEVADGTWRVLGRDALDGDAKPPAVPLSTDDLAYLLYTSGSTGQPKGVMLSHGNGMAFVEWATREYAVGADDRLSSHAPFHFDLSIFDIFAAAAAGAAVVLVPARTALFPAELGRFIESEGITVWYSVPSALTMLVQRGGLRAGQFPALRTVLFAGEVFPVKHLRSLMGLVPGARFSNLYGPTETNVCTFYDVPSLPEDRTEPIPIGHAIAGVEVFGVTDDGRRTGPGETGELYVGGPTVMLGYWGDPERTARALVVHPFDPGSGQRVYRTGDLVEVDAAGEYRFLGRRDNQVKTRGYRVELGEIEAALYAHPSVVECAVVAVPDEVVTNRLHAFVVVRDEVSEQELARFCATRVPKYMVPERIATQAALPKTSTGKIDRQVLATTPPAERKR